MFYYLLWSLVKRLGSQLGCSIENVKITILRALGGPQASKIPCHYQTCSQYCLYTPVQRPSNIFLVLGQIGLQYNWISREKKILTKYCFWENIPNNIKYLPTYLHTNCPILFVLLYHRTNVIIQYYRFSFYIGRYTI